MNSPAILNTMLERLERHRQFDAGDRTAILALPYTVRKLRPHEHLIREGKPAENSCLLRSGFLCRHKIIAAGHRQIVSVHMAGDMGNMQNSLLKTADHNVQALTEAEVVLISGRAIVELATARPNVAIAMWLDTLIDGSIFREWIANVHVNRTLKALEQAGLISRNRRSVTISDWDALRVAGDFDPAYLYLELAEGERSLVA